MILAIPAAIQAVKATSLAVKVGIILGIVALILGSGFYAGSRWEEANTLRVQAEFDKFKSDSRLAAQKQSDDARLENQRLRNEKELVDEENRRIHAALESSDERLRELSKKIANTSRVPGPPADTKRPDLAAFDRAELNRADDTYRAGVARLRGRIHTLAGEGAKAVVDLDSSKKWASRLPVQKSK